MVAPMDDGNLHVAHDDLQGALGRPLCSASEFELAAELISARPVGATSSRVATTLSSFSRTPYGPSCTSYQPSRTL